MPIFSVQEASDFILSVAKELQVIVFDLVIKMAIK